MLTFDTGVSAKATVVGDEAILTEPVSTLREVACSAADRGVVMRRWIAAEAFCSATKFNVRSHRQPWSLSDGTGDEIT